MTHQPQGKAVAVKQRELRVWEREKGGRKEEGGKVGDGRKRKDGKKGERFGCATVLFTAALTQNRTWLSQIV